MSSNVSINLNECCSKRKCDKLDWKQRAKLTIGFVMPLISMILGIYGYGKWHSNVESFDDQIANWKTDPVLSVVFSPSNSCPTGYTLQPTKYFNYTTVSCDCSSRTSSTSCDGISGSDWTSCGSGQSNCGCSTRRTGRYFDVPKWPGVYPYLCVQRATGQNALARLRATAGSCAQHANTKLCNYDDCVPITMDCPITNVTTVAPLIASTGGWVGTVDQNSTDYVMVYNRSVLSADPIAVTPEVEILIGQDTSEAARPDSRYYTFQQVSVQDVLMANDPSYVATLLTQQQSGYLTNPWMMTMRREMPWQPTCPTTRTRMGDLYEKVKIIDTAQLAVMLISIAMALYNFVAAMHDYNEMTDDDPHNDGNIQKKKAVCNMVGEVINLVPTIVAMAIASTIYGEFNGIKNVGGCSDPITNAPLTSLAGKLNDLSTINVIKTILSGLYLAFRIISYLRVRFCPKSAPNKTHVADSNSQQMAHAPEYNPNQ